MNTNGNLSMRQWQEGTALTRFQIIAPFRMRGWTRQNASSCGREIAERNGLSEKTVKRYDDAYKRGGFEGLKPKRRSPHNPSSLAGNFEDVVQEAIQLRREVPSRFVDKIITILEMEGRVVPGVLKRSTLQRHLYRAGFGSGYLRAYREARESSAKRFCKPHRMILLQVDYSDIIFIPIFFSKHRLLACLSEKYRNNV